MSWDIINAQSRIGIVHFSSTFFIAQYASLYKAFMLVNAPLLLVNFLICLCSSSMELVVYITFLTENDSLFHLLSSSFFIKSVSSPSLSVSGLPSRIDDRIFAYQPWCSFGYFLVHMSTSSFLIHISLYFSGLTQFI